jgi:signal transduction histidine kinase
MRLRRKLNLISIAAFALLIILTVLFQLPVNKRQEQIFIDGIIRLLDILISNEGAQLANAIFENRNRAISLRLEKMLQLQGVENVILYNNQGAMINFALGSDKDGSEIKTGSDYTNADVFTEELIYQNEASLHYEHIIKFGDDILGFIEIFYSIEEIKEQSRRSLIVFISSVSVSLIIIFLLLNLILSRAVVYPIIRLINAIKVYNLESSEHHENKIEVRSKDEIGELTESYNRLSEKIHNYSRELQKKNIQLVRSQKMEMIGTLAGGLAHDFNNILGGIIGSVSLLKLYQEDNDLTDEKLTDNLAIIEKSSKRATDVVSKLMDFSRKEIESKIVVDLNGIVTDVIEICKTTIDKSLNLRSNLMTGDLLVEADPGQIEQVILNLCINAAHSMTIMRSTDDRNGGILSIATGRTKVGDNGYCTVTISDTGIGIKQENLLRIFDPFFSTKNEDGGTGLGLAMASSIIDQHEGYLDVDSTPGEGTTFHIHLLAYKGDMGVPIKPEEKQIKTGVNKILLVDDEEILREVFRELLMECGYEVMLAKNGQEALSLYRKYFAEIDLILLDMSMPGMSGDEVYSKLKTDFPDIRVLISSGSEQDSRIREMLINKNIGFIKKPYSIHNLSDSIYKIIYGKDTTF